eukprot:764016-Hanusia_phi.AAC.1
MTFYPYLPLVISLTPPPLASVPPLFLPQPRISLLGADKSSSPPPPHFLAFPAPPHTFPSNISSSSLLSKSLHFLLSSSLRVCSFKAWVLLQFLAAAHNLDSFFSAMHGTPVHHGALINLESAEICHPAESEIALMTASDKAQLLRSDAEDSAASKSKNLAIEHGSHLSAIPTLFEFDNRDADSLWKYQNELLEDFGRPKAVMGTKENAAVKNLDLQLNKMINARADESTPAPAHKTKEEPSPDINTSQLDQSLLLREQLKTALERSRQCICLSATINLIYCMTYRVEKAEKEIQLLRSAIGM